MPVARLAAERLPELIREAEACGAIVLARYLGQALTEAEDILSQEAPGPS